MNHQSVFDIPIACWLVHTPIPLIPYRGRYERGIPGVSPILRAVGMPKVRQRSPRDGDQDLRAIAEAADGVAHGENSIVIFPEGHRTRTGEIERFMRRGLTVILSRAKRPVYCVVIDGLWHARTTMDVVKTLGGSTVNISVLGPFSPPPDEEIQPFVDRVRGDMIQALEQMRGSEG